MLVPRFYQVDAIKAGLDFFHSKKKGNEILICPTGSGKSVIIALIATELVKSGKVLILQPSKEILHQNFAKFISYGCRAGIYSASAGMKYRDDVTFCTIGSIAKKHHLFHDYKYILVDECHLVNAEEGMYHALIKTLEHSKVLGLTATPYRLSAGMEGAMLKFITRTSPRIFNRVAYCIQNDILFNAGFLAPLNYYSFSKIDRNKLETNAKGTDFTDASLKAYYRQINMQGITIDYANRLLAKRNNILVFCSLISEAYDVAKGVPGSVVLTGDTPAAERDKILAKFKKGDIRCVINVGVLTTGFDYPGLEVVLIARSTMSLALYYQIIGRIMRPFKYADGTTKTGWVVDLGGNIDLFGKIETMRIETTEKGLYYISNTVNGQKKQLTNVSFQKAA